MKSHDRKNGLKKICYIEYKVHPGPNFDYLSKIVAKNGYEVSFILLHEPAMKEREVVDGITVYRIPLPVSSSNRKAILSFISKATELIDENHTDIVHIHSSCAYFALFRLRSNTQTRFIYHSLSYPLAASSIQRIKQMFFINFQCLVMNKTIFQSQEALEHWEGKWMIRNTSIVPVGFDRNALNAVSQDRRLQMRQSLNYRDGQCVSVFCGSIAKFRKVDHLIKAFAIVVEQMDNARLLMIGDGNALMECKALATSLGIGKKIKFTGRIAHSKLIDYFGASDIGLSYVPINENYTYNPPVKTFDYLACGLPIVATRTVSNSKIITEGFNGVLTIDSFQEVAKAIIYLIENGKLRDYMRKNARKSILSFDFEKIAENYLIPLYEEILA